MSRNPIKDGIGRVLRAVLLRPASRLLTLGRAGEECPDMARMAATRREAEDRRLRRYEEEIEKLRLENEHLRVSATTFGELAERLNKSLKSAGGRGRTPVPRGG